MINKAIIFVIFGIFLISGFINPSAREMNEKCDLVTKNFNPQLFAGVVITEPIDGDTVQGIVTISVSASYDVIRVEFFIDDELKYLDNEEPFSVAWDSRSYTNGSHVIKVIGYSETSSSSDQISVIVNLPPDSPVLSGDNYAKMYETWECFVQSYDIEGDMVWYFIDYDNGEDSGWIGPYSPGIAVRHKYIWPEPGVYWVLAKAKDIYGVETSWSFYPLRVLVDPNEPSEPNLDCQGMLSWHPVNPGEDISGSFDVRNVGDWDTNLNWKIESFPEWGSLIFSQESGSNLKPDDGWFTIEINGKAPNEKDQTYEGEIILVNDDDNNDKCMIPVSLYTSKEKTYNNLNIYDIFINYHFRFSFIRSLFFQW